MLLTDTHCHLYLDKYDHDRQDVISRAKNAGIVRILIPGLDLVSSREAIQLAESDECLFAGVGFHPTELKSINDEAFSMILDFARHSKVMAIGEIGLDYYWIKDEGDRLLQRETFEQQLNIASSINKPVIIHMREEQDKWHGQASEDLIRILTRWISELSNTNHPLLHRPGVFHAFNGTLETAQKVMELGFKIGIAGPVTYKNAEEKRGIISQLPLDQVLIETDSPFLTPVPHRGKRNEPAFVREIADKIAYIKSNNLEEVADITTRNAAQLFLW
jgi:TatD DNase family protein